MVVVALLLLVVVVMVVVVVVVVAGMTADWMCSFPLPLLRLRRRLRLQLLRIAAASPLASRLAGNSKGPQTPDTPMACPSRA